MIIDHHRTMVPLQGEHPPTSAPVDGANLGRQTVRGGWGVTMGTMADHSTRQKEKGGAGHTHESTVESY